MIGQRRGGLIVLVAACAAGSYLATYALQQPDGGAASRPAATPCGREVSAWLELSPQQAAKVQALETAFAADRAALEARLGEERERLAALLENPATANEDITAQIELVIAAHDALERRVGVHLIAMRPHLTADQQKRLFERCASGVRESGGRGWQHGRPDGGGGERRGGGPPPGRGPRGRGREGS